MPSWLTYADAGEKFGISAEAVRHLTVRHRWPRRKPNDDPYGRVLVGIPDDFEPRPRPTVERPAADPVELPDARPLNGRPLEHLAAFESVLAELRAVRDEATERAKAAETLVDHTLALLADAQAGRDRADAALAGERSRADVLRDRVDALTGELREAQETAETMRQEEIARHARGLLARLRDAWRGD
jgi:hypothetical protein